MSWYRVPNTVTTPSVCSGCIWRLTKAREKQCRKACVEHVACLVRPWSFFFARWPSERHTQFVKRSSFSVVFTKSHRVVFLLMLGGTSGETAVHVVARLSSHVFTLARDGHGRCGHRITGQHHPCLATLVAALPSPPPTNFLRCR